jgi:hypothetical protein
MAELVSCKYKPLARKIRNTQRRQRHLPGDGFSEDEARPTKGFLRHTIPAKRKRYQPTPNIGPLQLAQIRLRDETTASSRNNNLPAIRPNCFGPPGPPWNSWEESLQVSLLSHSSGRSCKLVPEPDNPTKALDGGSTARNKPDVKGNSTVAPLQEELMGERDTTVSFIPDTQPAAFESRHLGSSWKTYEVSDSESSNHEVSYEHGGTWVINGGVQTTQRL